LTPTRKSMKVMKETFKHLKIKCTMLNTKQKTLKLRPCKHNGSQNMIDSKENGMNNIIKWMITSSLWTMLRPN
jgi:hypothetical protein